MTCMMPMAPAFEVIGFPSWICVRPPLSMRITALIQVSATWNRREAFLINGAQRSTSFDGLIVCSLTNSDAVATGVVLAKPLDDARTSAAAMRGADTSFATRRDGHFTMTIPCFLFARKGAR